MVICGMSLGWAEPDAPETHLATERVPVPAFARFLERGAPGPLPRIDVPRRQRQ